MTRPSTIELYAQAGFQAGEVSASRNLRSAFCAGTATVDQLAEYSQYADKWNRYAELEAANDQAVRREAAAPDPTRHDADPDGGLGAAFRAHRDGQAGRRLTVHRVKMVSVDMGEGGMQDLPEAPPLKVFLGSAGSCSGHERIRADLNSRKKR